MLIILHSLFTIIYPKQTMSLRYIQCCSCSVFTVCATCNVISHVNYVVYFYISTSRSVCVCSAQYGCCLQFLNFVLSWYVARVLSEWFWNDSSSLLLLLLLRQTAFISLCSINRFVMVITTHWFVSGRDKFIFFYNNDNKLHNEELSDL